MQSASVLLPFIGFFAFLAIGHSVGRAGWFWFPILFCAGLVVAIIALILRWSLMPYGLDRVIYLAVALFFLVPVLVGWLLGVWLGRRKASGA